MGIAMSACHRMKLFRKFHLTNLDLVSRRTSTSFLAKDNQSRGPYMNGRTPWSIPGQGGQVGTPLQLRNTSSPSYVVLKEYAFNHSFGANSHKNLAINVLNSLSFTNTEKLNSHQLVQLIQSLVEAQYTYLYMHLPWLEDDIRIAKGQMKLMECDQSVMEPIVTHSSFMTLRDLISYNLGKFTADELSQVLLCLFCLGLSPEDTLVTKLLTKCHSKFDEYSMKGLADLIDCYWLIPRVHLYYGKQVIKRVHECLDMLNDDASDLNLNHLSSLMGGISVLSPFKLWVKTFDRTLHHLETKGNAVSPTSVLSAIRLVHRAPAVIRDENKHILFNIIDKSCVVIKSKIDSLKITEVGHMARVLTKSNAYNSEMQTILFGRAQELLSSETRINNVLSALDTLTKASPIEVKEQFVEAVMNTNQEIDIVHLTNLAFSCLVIGIQNKEFLLKCQKEIAENVTKILNSDTGTYKVVKFLIFNKFSDKSHEKKFVDALLDSLHGNNGISNFRVNNLVSFLLCHAETSMSDNLLNKMIASIPKWTPAALYTFMCGLNKVKEPVPGSLRQQVCFIQEFLFSILCYKVTLVNDIPRLHKLYIEFGAHSKRQDPALAEIILDQMYKVANSSLLSNGSIKRMLCSLIEKRTPYRPEICDTLLEQISHQEPLSEEKIVNILMLTRLCELVGHQPVKFDVFISLCKDALNGLLESDLRAALKMLLSLSTLEAYPEEELSKVFTMEFMERIDNVVSEDEKLGKQLQHLIAQLNRDVVLECPQLNAPWFSEMYFTESYSKPHEKKYHLFQVYHDIADALETILGGRQFFQLNSYTSYFHNIDFHLVLNQDKIPVNIESLGNSFPQCRKGSVVQAVLNDDKTPVAIKNVENHESTFPQHQSTSIVILYQREVDFCYNSKHLKGFEAKKVRQLQIQGYKVVEVPYYEWFSMAHTSWQEKLDYLSNKIFD